MKLYLINHDYRYAVEQIMLTVFPQQRPEYPDGPPCGDRAEIALHRGAARITAVCRLYIGDEKYSAKACLNASLITDRLVEDRLLQSAVKRCFYSAALQYTGEKPVWGMLTGIRPGKLMSNLLEDGLSPKRALSRFVRRYDVSNERAMLCLDTARASLNVSQALSQKDICLYIGIPFCPTRCAYCSFVSASVEKSMGLIPAFLDTLMREIAATAEAVNSLGLNVISIYIGGGTPTTLSPRQLDMLCTQLESCFDLSSMRDYTVEAGRPDTISEDKLLVLRGHGVDRVSVNPQTMEDHVLNAIGRKHTASDVISALGKVRSVQGFAVNMDLIAGLPDDSEEGFRRTLDTVLALGPENITVHTLSLKKGSRIMLDGTTLPPAEAVSKMLDTAHELLRGEGYAPYYLYRQKYMSGGFENVGWSRAGYDNLYNICMMEELCSIIAMGAGASTKLVTGTGRIERLFTPKYPKEYIENIDRVTAQKLKIKEFYDGLRSE